MGFTGFDAMDGVECESAASAESGSSTVLIVVICVVFLCLALGGGIGFIVWKKKKNEERSFSVRKSVELFHGLSPKQPPVDLFANERVNTAPAAETTTDQCEETMSSPRTPKQTASTPSVVPDEGNANTYETTNDNVA